MGAGHSKHRREPRSGCSDWPCYFSPPRFLLAAAATFWINAGSLPNPVCSRNGTISGHRCATCCTMAHPIRDLWMARHGQAHCRV